MKYFVIEELYDYYKKNLITWKLLNLLEKVLLIVAGILSLVWLSILFKDSKKIHTSVFWVTYVSSIILIFASSEIIRNRIINKYEIKNKKITIRTCLHIRRKEKLINDLAKDFSIKTKKQKEMLINIIRDNMKPRYELKQVWIIGFTGALILPIWNAFIEKSIGNDFATIQNNINSLAIIIAAVLVYAILIHFTFINNILYIMNTKRNWSKEIISILQEDLLLNYYNKTEAIFNGELILVKKL